MQSNRSRQIGDLGETAVTTLCQKAGYTVQPPSQDRHGWDLMIERSPNERVSADAGSTSPLDKSLPPPKVFLQVKSTDSEKGYVDVKLSTFRDFALSGGPCFLVFVEFGGKSDPQNVYVVHVGEDILRALLKRLRDMDPDDVSLLSRKQMRVRYDDRDPLENLTAECFRNHLADWIDRPNYIEWKKELVDTLGYENGGYRVRADVHPPTSYKGKEEDYWLDHLLGIAPRAKLDNVEVQDVRFGIKSDVPFELDLTDATFELRITPQEGTLIFSTEAKGQLLRLPCEILVPPGQKEGTPVRKYRVDVGFGDLIFDTEEERSTMRLRLPNPSDEIPLREHYRIARFMRLLGQSSKKGRHVRLSAAIEGQTFELGSLDFREIDSLADLDSPLARTIIDAWAAARYFGVEDETDLAAAEIMAQKTVIQHLSVLVSSTVEPTTAKLLFRRPQSQEEETETDSDAEQVDGAVCVIGSEVALGESWIFFCIGMFGQIERTSRTEAERVWKGLEAKETDDMWYMSTDQVAVIDHFILPRDDSLPKPVPDLLKQAGRNVADEGKAILAITAEEDGSYCVHKAYT